MTRGHRLGGACDPDGIAQGRAVRMEGAEVSSDGALFRCPLPADTTRVVVRLSGSGRVLLTREFAYNYRFVLE